MVKAKRFQPKVKSATIRFVFVVLAIFAIVDILDKVLGFDFGNIVSPIFFPFILSMSLLLEVGVFRTLRGGRLNLGALGITEVILGAIGLLTILLTFFATGTGFINFLAPFSGVISGLIGAFFVIEIFRD